MNPKISVVMSVYQESKEVLKASILSILEQTLKDFEFIIIIDNPFDSWRSQYIRSLKDSRIRLLVNDTNIGIAHSLNKGIGKARGRYIARMDADDISYPHRLEKQLAYLEKENLDFIGSFICSFNDDQKEKIGYPRRNKTIQKFIYYRDVFSHPTFFFRKEVYLRVNGYTDIPYVEDYDFIFKVIKAGFKVGNVPEILLNYRLSEKGITNSNRAEQWVLSEMLKNHYRISNKDFTIEQLNHYLKQESYKDALNSINIYLQKKKNVLKTHGLKRVFLILGLFHEKRFRKNVSYRIIKRLVVLFRL